MPVDTVTLYTTATNTIAVPADGKASKDSSFLQDAACLVQSRLHSKPYTGDPQLCCLVLCGALPGIAARHAAYLPKTAERQLDGHEHLSLIHI